MENKKKNETKFYNFTSVHNSVSGDDIKTTVFGLFIFLGFIYALRTIILFFQILWASR